METIDIVSLPIKLGDNVLDLGCGEGRHSIAVSYSFPNANIFAIDLDIHSLRAAKEKHRTFLNTQPKAIYIHSSGHDLPFNDNHFDHIICSEVLEHIPNYTDFLDEIYRVLKPKGYLSISVPRAWPEKLCWILSDDYHANEGGHVHIFNKDALIKTVSQRGYALIRSHWAHALHSPYWWLRCMWWRNGKDNIIAKQYHKLLVWDLLKRPRFTQSLERILNPLCGKSIVLYFKKEARNDAPK